MAAPENLTRIVGLYGDKADIELFTATLEEIALALSSDSDEIGLYVGGAWVWISGNNVSDVTATTPIVSSGGTTPNLTHADSGATPGTYTSVTVDAKGHVTAGSNPATASGEVLMVDGVTPPEPMTTEDGTDWLYED